MKAARKKGKAKGGARGGVSLARAKKRKRGPRQLELFPRYRQLEFCFERGAAEA